MIPWWPVVWLDIFGSALCLVIGFWCIACSWAWARRKEQDHFRHYLFLLTVAIGTFTISRSFGHLVKQFLLMADRVEVWKDISPYSGAVNTVTFIAIFAFGIYFDRVRQIKLQADRAAVTLATTRALADAALESESRLRTIFDGIQDAICLSDDERRIIFFNKRLESLAPGIAVGQQCHQVLFQLPQPCKGCRFADLGEGESFSREVELAGTGKVVNITGIRLRWVDGQDVNLSVIRDITERKRLESQLLQSQKMEAVGTLAGGIAHDFNNVLTAIIGYSDVLQLKLGDDNPLRAEVGEIRRAAARAAALVRQLLTFSRKQKTSPQVVDLNILLRDMAQMVDRLIGEDVELVMELAGTRLPVRVDPAQVEQVVMNLVINSRDAIVEGGRITITTEEVTVDAEFCRQFVDAAPGRFVRMTVRDNGFGMTQEVIDKIFEPFFTTKEVGKGTGLGLAVVYGIVKQHGGWLNVSSEVGVGSAIAVYLPQREWEPPAPLAADGLAGKGGGEGILLVEDQEEVRRVAAEMLVASGYRVLSAASRAEAEALIAAEGDAIELLFCDIVLPDGNGFQLVERLRQLRPGLPVLMCSGYADDKAQSALLAERRLPFLQKPYSMAGLLAAIRQVLAGSEAEADRVGTKIGGRRGGGTANSP